MQKKLPLACNCTPGVMWMNSGLSVIFELQMNPITKSECSSAIFSWKDRKDANSCEQTGVDAVSNGRTRPQWRCAHHSLCVFACSKRPLGAHLSNEQTASTQRLPDTSQTLHDPGPRHSVSIHYVGP